MKCYYHYPYYAMLDGYVGEFVVGQFKCFCERKFVFLVCMPTNVNWAIDYRNKMCYAGIHK